MTASERQTETTARVGVAVIGVAMLVVGALTFHYGWTFTAMWTAGGSPFGIGWVIQAVLWMLRQVPATAWAIALVVFGAIFVKAGIRPAARTPQAPDATSPPMRPGGSGMKVS